MERIFSAASLLQKPLISGVSWGCDDDEKNCLCGNLGFYLAHTDGPIGTRLH